MGDGDICMAGDADIRMPAEEWNALVTDAVHGSGSPPYMTLDVLRCLLSPTFAPDFCCSIASSAASVTLV